MLSMFKNEFHSSWHKAQRRGTWDHLIPLLSLFLAYKSHQMMGGGGAQFEFCILEKLWDIQNVESTTSIYGGSICFAQKSLFSLLIRRGDEINECSCGMRQICQPTSAPNSHFISSCKARLPLCVHNYDYNFQFKKRIKRLAFYLT